ncbi:MAG: hypothetical protein ACRCZI_12325 [Cetobacterium sp.]
MKIYVASSWRNIYQELVVGVLRRRGYEVYDFREGGGFSWREVDEHWLRWRPQEYLEGLNHVVSQRGYGRDMHALMNCDVCIMVMPCGLSSGLELGYAVGHGKRTAVYVPSFREPELMVKMADYIALNISDLVMWVEK